MSGLPGDMPGFVRAIVEASLGASALAAVVLALQYVPRRILPARYAFALWFLVLIRLTALPLPQSRVSVLNFFGAAHSAAVSDVAVARERAPAAGAVVAHPTLAVTMVEPVTGVVANATPAVEIEDHKVATTGSVTAREEPAVVGVGERVASAGYWSPWVLLTTVYLVGVVIMMLRHVLATLALRRIVRAATALDEPGYRVLLDRACGALGVRRVVEILVTDAIGSPAVAGLWRPRLLMPRGLLESLAPQEMYFVFLHECGHLRRHDILLNWWLAALGAVHWFNPVVWLVMPRIRADRELACDELVLMHTTDPAPYGHTLLRILETVGALRPAGTAVGIVETRSYFARRIQMIASFRKTPRWLAAPAGAAVLLLACATLTNAVLRADDGPGANPRLVPTPAAPGTSSASSVGVGPVTPAPAVGATPGRGVGVAPMTDATGGAAVPGLAVPAAFPSPAGNNPFQPSLMPPASETLVVKVFPLKYADAQSAVESITGAMVAPNGRVVADKRTNSIVLNAPGDEMKQAEALIAALDQPSIEPAAKEPASPVKVVVYDVHQLINVPDSEEGALTQDQRAALGDLAQTVTDLVKDPTATISRFNGTLVVSGSEEVQKKISAILSELHDAHDKRIEMQQKHGLAPHG